MAGLESLGNPSLRSVSELRLVLAPHSVVLLSEFPLDPCFLGRWGFVVQRTQSVSEIVSYKEHLSAVLVRKRN